MLPYSVDHLILMSSNPSSTQVPVIHHPENSQYSFGSGYLHSRDPSGIDRFASSHYSQFSGPHDVLTQQSLLNGPTRNDGNSSEPAESALYRSSLIDSQFSDPRSAQQPQASTCDPRSIQLAPPWSDSAPLSDPENPSYNPRG